MLKARALSMLVITAATAAGCTRTPFALGGAITCAGLTCSLAFDLESKGDHAHQDNELDIPTSESQGNDADPSTVRKAPLLVPPEGGTSLTPTL